MSSRLLFHACNANVAHKISHNSQFFCNMYKKSYVQLFVIIMCYQTKKAKKSFEISAFNLFKTFSFTCDHKNLLSRMLVISIM